MPRTTPILDTPTGETIGGDLGLPEDAVQEVAQDAEEGQPGLEGQEIQPNAGTGPEEEHYLYRWRQDEYKIPRRIVQEIARSINAPSEEAALNWLQSGRDASYQNTENRRIRAELDNYGKQLQAYERQLMARARQAGNANVYGRPVSPQPQTRTPFPEKVDPNNPQEMLQMLSALPSVIQELRNEFRTGINGVAGIFQGREEEEAVMREANTVQTEATKFLEQLRADGWNLPEDMDEDWLIGECNRLGLSYDKTLSWPEAFEIVGSRRLYRHAYKLGAAKVAERLQTSRKEEFRTPAARPPALGRTGGAPTGGGGGSLKDKAEEAMALARTIRVGDALGE